jgi:hypothetical protein
MTCYYLQNNYSNIYITPRHPTKSPRHLFQPVRRSSNAVAPIAVCGRAWSVSGSVAKLGASGLNIQTVMQHYNRRSVNRLMSPASTPYHSFHHITYQERNLKPSKDDTNFFLILHLYPTKLKPRDSPFRRSFFFWRNGSEYGNTW